MNKATAANKSAMETIGAAISATPTRMCVDEKTEPPGAAEDGDTALRR
jgi:hypothetical protein